MRMRPDGELISYGHCAVCHDSPPSVRDMGCYQVLAEGNYLERDTSAGCSPKTMCINQQVAAGGVEIVRPVYYHT